MTSVKTGNHGQQFTDPAGRRQRQVNEMVRQVEVTVFAPVVQAVAANQPPVEGRRRPGGLAQLLRELRREFPARAGGRLEKHEHAHVQRLPAAFQPQEGIVDHAELFHAGGRGHQAGRLARLIGSIPSSFAMFRPKIFARSSSVM